LRWKIIASDRASSLPTSRGDDRNADEIAIRSLEIEMGNAREDQPDSQPRMPLAPDAVNVHRKK
jgi:hypothetical protein